MASLQDHSETTVAARGKPCLACRKRKVKCDKTRPCSNCSRSKQLCTYETSHDSIGSGVDSHDGLQNEASILERLSRLEELMAKAMAHGEADSDGQHRIEGEVTSTRGVPATSKIVHTNQAFQYQPIHGFSFPGTKFPVGLQIFKEGFSGYFSSEFWPGTISEVCPSI